MDENTEQVNINGNIFYLVLNENDKSHVVRYNRKNYTSLIDLTKAAQFLSNAENLLGYAQIANFIFTGQDFEVIEDAASYQNDYREIHRGRLGPYGTFDVSSITFPYVTSDGMAVFFVQNKTSNVPYKVICTYPFTGSNATFQYKLFPEVTE